VKRRTFVLGGGITGLTAAWRLAEAGCDVTVIEKEKELGGQARTIAHNGFRLDLGAHKIFTVMRHVQAILEDLAGDQLLKREKIGRIYYGGRYLPFPMGVKDILRHMPPWRVAQLVASYAKSRGLNVVLRREPRSYEEWFIANYGRAIYEGFVKDATEKIWGVASDLSLDLASRRVTAPTLKELLRQFFFSKAIGRLTSTDYFYYPKDGCQVFVDALARRIAGQGGRILTETYPVRVRTGSGRLTAMELNSGEVIELGPADTVVNTVPKKDLVRVLESDLPGEVAYSLAMLRERGLLLTYIFLKQERAMEPNWIFFPERRFLFNRLFEQKNCSPFMCPADQTVLCAETTCHEGQVFSPAARDYMGERIVGSLNEIGLIRREHVTDIHFVFMDHAYPLWDRTYKQNLSVVLSYMDAYENLYSVGRQGGFVYGGIADCLDVGLVTAAFVASGRPKSEWSAERKKFDEYVVID
jgi:protoporphyrinogen oxidase